MRAKTWFGDVFIKLRKLSYTIRYSEVAFVSEPVSGWLLLIERLVPISGTNRIPLSNTALLIAIRLNFFFGPRAKQLEPPNPSLAAILVCSDNSRPFKMAIIAGLLAKCPKVIDSAVWWCKGTAAGEQQHMWVLFAGRIRRDIKICTSVHGTKIGCLALQGSPWNSLPPSNIGVLSHGQ